MADAQIYACSPDLVWLQDDNMVLLVDRRRRESWRLRGTDAILWTWTALGYRYQAMTRMLALLLGLSDNTAQVRVDEAIQAWHVAGIIEHGV